MINQILIGDVLEKLKEIPEQYVNTVITSPPYWGLRDYGTAQWKGGNPECDHKETAARNDGMRERVNGFHGSSKKDSDKGSMNYRHICKGCGAIRIDDQIGLEKTPEEYVEKMVSGFREVRRVLRDDGTLWLNLGDSYASDYKGSGGSSEKQDSNAGSRYKPRKLNHGVKPKDLVGIPWMIAFALRADGADSPRTMEIVEKIKNALLYDFDSWEKIPDKTRNILEQLEREWEDAHRGAWYLRQDIIWHKPNPMPESVTDRCTKAHEYIFLLSKSRQYYYDADAIKEPACGSTIDRNKYARAGNPRDLLKKEIDSLCFTKPSDNSDSNKKVEIMGRNKRSVWTVTTKPFPGAHFATFPPDLIKPCILAGCPRGGIVLDPFFGSGTVGLMALKNARHYIGIELNPDYAEMAKNRIEYGTVDEEKVIEEKKQGTLFEDLRIEN